MALKKRVVVAMSGGVDSSVAAALLQKQGFDVVGISMCFNHPDHQGVRPSCCGSSGIEDARRVARVLGIPYYTVNMQRHLAAHVIADFRREYARGRTPNPCVRCNQFIKFSVLLKKALQLGAAFLATGHYARIATVGRRHMLKKGRDPEKDQSYFLYRLNQQQLARILFPLGGLLKNNVRALARTFHLPVADKPGSQEICFLPHNDYRRFLKESCALDENPGDIVDAAGRVLGRHTGIAFYTVGQRKGLKIAAGYPLYVRRIDAPANRIEVGPYKQALSKRFWVRDVQYSVGRLKQKKEIEATVKIRYNHSGERARIVTDGRRVLVTFKRAQFAVAPGQAAVFYERQTVIGGGTIDEVV